MSEDELWELRIALIKGSGFTTIFAHANQDSTSSYRRKKFRRPKAQKKEVVRYIIPYIAPYQNPAWDPSGSFQNLPVYTPPPPMTSDGIPMIGNVQYDSSGKPVESTTRRYPEEPTLQDEGYRHPYAWDLGGGYTDETLPSQQTWYPY